MMCFLFTVAERVKLQKKYSQEKVKAPMKTKSRDQNAGEC